MTRVTDDGYVSVYVTAASKDQAKELAGKLLEKRLIACANVLPCESVFTWEGGVQDEPEVVMFMKTRRAIADDVVAAVADLHPYDVPCAVVFDLEGGHKPYLDWVRAETTRS